MISLKNQDPINLQVKYLAYSLILLSTDIKVAFSIFVDKIRMRAEMSSGTSSAEHGTESAIEPNEWVWGDHMTLFNTVMPLAINIT